MAKRTNDDAPITLTTAQVAALAADATEFRQRVDIAIRAGEADQATASLAALTSALVDDLSPKLANVDNGSLRAVFARAASEACKQGSVKDARKVVTSKANATARKALAKCLITPSAFVSAAQFPGETTGTLTADQVNREVSARKVSVKVSKAALLATAMLASTYGVDELAEAVAELREIVIGYVTGTSLATRDEAYNAAREIVALLGIAAPSNAGGRPKMTTEQAIAKLRKLAAELAENLGEGETAGGLLDAAASAELVTVDGE